MFALPHMTVGAAVGKALKRPSLVVPAALAAHFACDYVPHLDAHSLFGGRGPVPTAPEAATAIADFVIASVLVGWIAWRRPERWSIVVGALAGVIIDLINHVPPMAGWCRATDWGMAIARFHHWFQHNLVRGQWLAGLAPQVVVTALALFYLLRPSSQLKTQDSQLVTRNP